MLARSLATSATFHVLYVGPVAELARVLVPRACPARLRHLAKPAFHKLLARSLATSATSHVLYVGPVAELARVLAAACLPGATSAPTSKTRTVEFCYWLETTRGVSS